LHVSSFHPWTFTNYAKPGLLKIAISFITVRETASSIKALFPADFHPRPTASSLSDFSFA
jgi:hypothetical protein